MTLSIQLVPFFNVYGFKHLNLKYQIMLHVLKTFFPLHYPGPTLF